MINDGVHDELDLCVTVQVSDTRSLQNQKRVCGDDRTQLSKKSLRSLIDSLQHCAQQRPLAKIKICLVCDDASADLIEFCDKLQSQVHRTILVTIKHLENNHKMSGSIGASYQWLQEQGRDLIAHFQDDYIFKPQAIDDCVDIWMQLQTEADTQAIVTPFQYAVYWLRHYDNIATPRAIKIGRNDYWIQLYDISCSFLTAHQQFSNHWDIYHDFFHRCDLFQQGQTVELESKSLNTMLTQRGVLALGPMRNLSFHLQSDYERDPHQNWQDLWDTINVNF